MPINRAQFEGGLDDTQRRIIEFLSRDRDQAFTLEEISKGTGLFLSQRPQGQGIDIQMLVSVALGTFAMSHVLNQLVSNGKVVSKTIGGQQYYMIKS